MAPPTRVTVYRNRTALCWRALSRSRVFRGSAMPSRSCLTLWQAWTIAILVAIALTAEALTVSPRYASGTIASMPYLAAVLLVPNCSCGARRASSVLAVRRARSDQLMKGAFNVAQTTLAMTLAVVTYRAMGGVELRKRTEPDLRSSDPGCDFSWPAARRWRCPSQTAASSLSEGKPVRQIWLRDLQDRNRYGFSSPTGIPVCVALRVSRPDRGPSVACGRMLLVRNRAE